MQALIDDIERHLSRLPVLARPDSAGYRLRKFVARNRWGVAAGGAVALAVLGGSAAALWQAHAARVQQQRAEQVKDFIAGIFTDADPFRGAQQALDARELLQRARSRLDAAGFTDPALRVELQTVLAGSLLGQQDGDGAGALLRQAIALANQALGPDHLLTLRARTLLLQVPGVNRERAALRSEVESLLPLLQRRGADVASEHVQALTVRAGIENDEGRCESVLATVDEAMAVADRHLSPVDEHRLVAQRMRVNANENLRRMPEAVRHAEAAVALAERLYPPPNKHPTLIDTRFVYGRVLSDADRAAEGLALIRQAIADATEVLGPDTFRVATFTRTMVKPLLAVGDVDGARRAAETALRQLSALLSADHLYVGYAWVAKASVHAAADEPAAAAQAYERALAIIVPALGPDAAYALHLRLLQAVQQAHAGDATALERIQALVGRHASTRHPRLADALLGQAEALRRLGRAAEALALLQQSQPAIDGAGSKALRERARRETERSRAAAAAKADDRGTRR